MIIGKKLFIIFHFLYADITFECTIDTGPGVFVSEARNTTLCISVDNGTENVQPSITLSLYPVLTFFLSDLGYDNIFEEYFVVTRDAGM